MYVTDGELFVDNRKKYEHSSTRLFSDTNYGTSMNTAHVSLHAFTH